MRGEWHWYFIVVHCHVSCMIHIRACNHGAATVSVCGPTILPWYVGNGRCNTFSISERYLSASTETNILYLFLFGRIKWQDTVVHTENKSILLHMYLWLCCRRHSFDGTTAVHVASLAGHPIVSHIVINLCVFIRPLPLSRKWPFLCLFLVCVFRLWFVLGVTLVVCENWQFYLLRNVEDERFLVSKNLGCLSHFVSHFLLASWHNPYSRYFQLCDFFQGRKWIDWLSFAECLPLSGE